MDEEKENNSTAKNMAKGVLKKSSKKLLIIILIIALVLGLIPAIYVKLGDDFKKVSQKNSSYTTKIDENGQVIYVKNGDGQEGDDDNKEDNVVTIDDMVKDFKEVIGEYINGKEEDVEKKIKYIIEAETVTKLPYIEPSKQEDTEEKLVGQIKFYRYSNEAESNAAYIKEDKKKNEETLDDKYRIKYITPERFKYLEESYKTSGNEEVFDYFTMDKDGNVVIAYGSTEIRTITTDGDSDLTLEVVREKSGESSYAGGKEKGYQMIKYTIEEKKIDYLSYVQKYVMPSNLLYALLVQTKDIDFVEAIAKLAYENVIAIGIYDNESETNSTETYTYNKVLELTLGTSLNFGGVNTTVPKISGATVKEYYVPYRRTWTLGRGSVSTAKRYFYSSNSVESIDFVRNLYVSNMDSDGKISKLENANAAKNFKTYFNKYIKAKSTPTVGILLADTWIAKWKNTYKMTTKTNQSGSESAETQSDYQITGYSLLEDLKGDLSGNVKSSLESQLNNESNDLKSKAVEAIVKNISSSIGFKQEIQNISVDSQTGKSILQSHLNSCQECMEIVNKQMPGRTIDQIYASVTLSVGKLNKTSVYTHYSNSVSYYINSQKENIEERTKQNFTNELNNQITYDQTASGTKKDINISFTSSKTTKTSTYKKEETKDIKDTITKDGEKFSEVFNDKKFYDSRQAVLKRIEWFWEYMRENEDTERLENVFRYLLNIATGTEDYIKDFDFQTMFEDMFKDKFNQMYSGLSELSVLRQLVNCFEGSTPIVTKNGTEYYVAVADELANGLPTIGHGITTYKDYLFPKEYQGWGPGSEIPVSVVDAVQEETLKEHLNSARAYFPEVTPYQAIALASASYNCGTGFLEALKNSGNVNKYIKEKQDKYGEKVDVDTVRGYVSGLEGSGSASAIKQQTIQEINCTLYTENWAQWTKADGVEYAGLIKRRYIEWLMFQYGYIYPTNSYWSAGEANDIQQKILEVAQNSEAYGIEARQGYCLAWVFGVYEKAFGQSGSACCAFDAGYKYGVSNDFSDIPVGAAIYGEGTSYEYGHVGIYIGDGKVADNIGYVRITTLDYWMAENQGICWGWACDTPVNSAYPMKTGLIHPGRHN